MLSPKRALVGAVAATMARSGPSRLMVIGSEKRLLSLRLSSMSAKGLVRKNRVYWPAAGMLGSWMVSLRIKLVPGWSGSPLPRS